MIHYDQIKAILEHNEASRDCDETLTEQVYRSISPNLIAMSWIAVSLKVRSKKIPSRSTISRVGRKVKEENPSLRGDNYIERKTKKVEYVKKKLGYDQQLKADMKGFLNSPRPKSPDEYR